MVAPPLHDVINAPVKHIAIDSIVRDSIVRGLETSHVSASLAVGTPRYIVNTY